MALDDKKSQRRQLGARGAQPRPRIAEAAKFARRWRIGYFRCVAKADKEVRIVLGVSGGIACYKAVELVRQLVTSGFSVQVVMTRGAMEFVTPLTFQSLSGHPVATDTFNLTQESEIGHINLADSADLMVIAPATANIIGKIANGIADDLLTTVVLATQAPLLLAPAMNVHMYENAIVQENLRKLSRVGYRVLEPAKGFLACGYEGSGRLPDPQTIVEEIHRLLRKKDLSDERLLITAGPSREPIDPVRYLSNRSSGKMGHALARAAVRRGASVVLVTGPTALEPPAGVRTIAVTTAAEMRQAVFDEFAAATTVIMAAAVADFRPALRAEQKIKRATASLELRLEPNPDIARELGQKKAGRLLVGFAAETEDLTTNAAQKLRDKNLDMIVANNVALENSGFDGDTNIATILDRTGATVSLPLMSKDEMADRIYDHCLTLKAKL